MATPRLYLIRAFSRRWQPARIRCTVLSAYDAADALTQWQVECEEARDTPHQGERFTYPLPLSIEPIEESDSRVIAHGPKPRSETDDRSVMRETIGWWEDDP